MKALLIVFSLFFSIHAQAKTVRYELSIANQKINITGQEVDFALTVNGRLPAPTLEFTEGDDAEIVVTNKLEKGEVSLHWHGILLPPEEDGVAYVNTPPIFPGASRTFRFKIRQHGTYWYHSHTMLQEQKGVYGPIVIHPKKELIKADREAVVVLSDWSDENADQIMRNLRKDGDYYLYKKKSLRSILGALQVGGLKTYFQNEWSRMGGMDLSDIGYDAFLINGKKDSQLVSAHAGEKIRLRIINSASSSYFYVSLADTPLQVISADGTDVEPVKAKELLIGMAETYDVLFTVPENKNYELRATVQDVTGYASTWIGGGVKVSAADKQPPDLYASMNHGDHAAHANMDHSKMDHSKMNHNKIDHSQMGVVAQNVHSSVIETLTVEDLKAQNSTTLPKDKNVMELKLTLSGNMERYTWSINDKAIFEDRYIDIKEGDVVRFVFENSTMMHHPMHLHGHFFRVLNKNEDYSPLKHTVDVPPMGRRTIEFYANEPGQWMLHCHNLYHMETGMARVVRYTSFKPSLEMQHLEHLDHHKKDHWYQTGSLKVATNAFEGQYKISQTWNEFEIRGESKKDEEWKGEGDMFYRRWHNNYLNFILGVSSVDQDYRGEIGIGYLLPLLIQTNLLIDHKGKLRLDLEKKIQWTSSLFTDAEIKWRQDEAFDNEFSLSLMYGLSWSSSIGLRYTGESLGFGFQYLF